MMRETEEINKLKSEEFRGLKKNKEEILPGSYNTEAIKGVQSFLNKEGFADNNGDALRVDGVYGANTANAVMKYQRANGLGVDGIVGDETWNSIYNKKKREESLFGRTEKIDKGIKLPTTHERPKRNTYKLESGGNESHFSSVLDEWKKMSAPLKGFGKADDESFHNKVRRRWGNGGIPSGMLTLSRDNTPGISPTQFRAYRPTGIAFNDYAFSEGESGFSGGNLQEDILEREYLTNDKLFAIEEPELTLMSNSGKKEIDGGESKAEEEKGTEEGGIINPGYNAKGEWSEDPDADNYGKDSAKYSMLLKLDEMYSEAEGANKSNIKSFADDFRNFDSDSICRAYYLNDEDGANEFGHIGLLLVDKDGDGILFSYGAAGNIIYGPARMHVGAYDKNGVDWLLKGQSSFVINENGNWLMENYNRWVDYKVSYKNGHGIFENAVDATVNLEKYSVLWNNCNQMVIEALKAGGINIEHHLIPNETFENIE